jgi:hypothetical protein
MWMWVPAIGLSLLLLISAGCVEPMSEEAMREQRELREAHERAKVETRAREQAEQAKKDEAWRALKEMQAKALTYIPRKSGFGTVLLVDFTITNSSDRPWRNFLVRCDIYAPNNDLIGSKSDTLLHVADPHSTKKIRDFNMGFIPQQADFFYCRIVSMTQDPALPPTTAVEAPPVSKGKKTTKARPDKGI